MVALALSGLGFLKGLAEDDGFTCPLFHLPFVRTVLLQRLLRLYLFAFSIRVPVLGYPFCVTLVWSVKADSTWHRVELINRVQAPIVAVVDGVDGGCDFLSILVDPDKPATLYPPASMTAGRQHTHPCWVGTWRSKQGRGKATGSVCKSQKG
jgi:hypothetical protein